MFTIHKYNINHMTAHHHLKTARTITHLMENQFSILGFKFGFDPLIGMIPGFGDLVSALLSAYLLWIGYQLRIPGKQLILMIWYIILDLLLGLIPIIGDASDFIFRSSAKNMEILNKYAPAEVVEGEVL